MGLAQVRRLWPLVVPAAIGWSLNFVVEDRRYLGEGKVLDMGVQAMTPTLCRGRPSWKGSHTQPGSPNGLVPFHQAPWGDDVLGNSPGF